MALIPKVVEVSRDRSTGLVYVLVDFYASLRDKRNGGPVVVREEFLMQLRATNRVAVGEPNPDNPAEIIVTGYVDEPVGVLAELRANIQRFVQSQDRVDGLRGDLTEGARGRPRLRDNADGDGLLAILRAEVEA